MQLWALTLRRIISCCVPSSPTVGTDLTEFCLTLQLKIFLQLRTHATTLFILFQLDIKDSNLSQTSSFMEAVLTFISFLTSGSSWAWGLSLRIEPEPWVSALCLKPKLEPLDWALSQTLVLESWCWGLTLSLKLEFETWGLSFCLNLDLEPWEWASNMGFEHEPWAWIFWERLHLLFNDRVDVN